MADGSEEDVRQEVPQPIAGDELVVPNPPTNNADTAAPPSLALRDGSDEVTVRANSDGSDHASSPTAPQQQSSVELDIPAWLRQRERRPTTGDGSAAPATPARLNSVEPHDDPEKEARYQVAAQVVAESIKFPIRLDDSGTWGRSVSPTMIAFGARRRGTTIKTEEAAEFLQRIADTENMGLERSSSEGEYVYKWPVPVRTPLPPPPEPDAGGRWGLLPRHEPGDEGGSAAPDDQVGETRRNFETLIGGITGEEPNSTPTNPASHGLGSATTPKYAEGGIHGEQEETSEEAPPQAEAAPDPINVEPPVVEDQAPSGDRPNASQSETAATADAPNRSAGPNPVNNTANPFAPFLNVPPLGYYQQRQAEKNAAAAQRQAEKNAAAAQKNQQKKKGNKIVPILGKSDSDEAEVESNNLHAAKLKTILAMHGISEAHADQHIKKHTKNALHIEMPNGGTVQYNKNGAQLKGRNGDDTYHATVAMLGHLHGKLNVSGENWDHQLMAKAHGIVAGVPVKTGWAFRHSPKMKKVLAKKVQELQAQKFGPVPELMRMSASPARPKAGKGQKGPDQSYTAA